MSMITGSRSPSRWMVALAGVLWLAATACADQARPTSRRATVAHLQLVADVAGTSVSTLVVEVSAADIQPSLVFDLEPLDGLASGTLAIPPGTARTLLVRAYDTSGNVTHEGQATIDVNLGSNPVVTVTLLPLAGAPPIDVRIGSLVVAVSALADSARVGQTIPLTVAITDPLGNPVSVDSAGIRWACFDTRIATVDEKGYVTGVDSGDVQVMASYAGAAGAATVSVVPSPVVLAAGDIADSSAVDPDGEKYDSLTANLLDTLPGTVLPLGDNAYEYGNLTEYTTWYDPTWGRQKARSRPVPGNHEYLTKTPEAAAGYWDYWGGQAGTQGKGYYSYDLGAWHLIALNSEIDVSATSAEVAWLAADLRATTARCVLAYWHRPRFSSGYHGNNYGVQALWDTLYAYGADVVLNGHDHDYERFAPQDPNGNADPVNGIREFVVGTGGAGNYKFRNGFEANSEFHLQYYHGVIRMVLGETGYHWEFIATDPFTGVYDSGSTRCH